MTAYFGPTAIRHWVGAGVPSVNSDSSTINGERGFSVGSTWVSTANGKTYVCTDATDGAAAWSQVTQPLHRAASSSPTSTSDSTDGYEVGSVWVNTTTDAVYVCADATEDAAVWAMVTNSGITAASIDAEESTDGYVLTSDGSGGAAWEAAAGGGPAYGQAGDPASAAQTVTTSMAQITGTTLDLPSLSAGDRLQISFGFEIVSNGGGPDNVTFRGRLGGENIVAPTAKSATGTYYYTADLIVDVAGASGEIRGYDGADFAQIALSSVDLSGTVALDSAVQSDGTTATVRVRSMSYIHYAA